MASGVAVGNYDSLDFNSPMTNETAGTLVAELASQGPSTIIDVGCGWGELLLRLAECCPDAVCVGIDNDEALLERARANATDRSLQHRVTFQTDLVVPEANDIAVCVGAEQVFGSLTNALTGLHDLVRPSGRLLLGTLCWDQQPSDEQAAEFSGVPELAEVVGIASDAGWRPLGMRSATLEDWDRFEFGFMADWEQVVMATEIEGETLDVRQLADEYRTGYLLRRGVLGFAYLTLGRPAFLGSGA